MSEAEHDVGPWHRGLELRNAIEINSGDEKDIITVNGDYDDDEVQARAALVIAAPDLLAMCRQMLAVARKHTDGSARFDSAYLDDIRVLVARATGKE